MLASTSLDDLKKICKFVVHHCSHKNIIVSNMMSV